MRGDGVDPAVSDVVDMNFKFMSDILLETPSSFRISTEEENCRCDPVYVILHPASN